LSAVEMIGSGVQKPAPLSHVASCDCTDAGTSAAGRQCAPEHPPPSQAGSVVGSSSGGPVHGHVMMVGGCVGLSHPRLQAPVGAVGSVAIGL
jgi:hypothetical protein